MLSQSHIKEKRNFIFLFVGLINLIFNNILKIQVKFAVASNKITKQITRLESNCSRFNLL